MRKLDKLKGNLMLVNPACVIEGLGDARWTIDFSKLGWKDFRRAVLRDRNEDNSRKKFGVYTIYPLSIELAGNDPGARARRTVQEAKYKESTMTWMKMFY